MKQCQRPLCPNEVSRASHKFCSPSCARFASSTQTSDTAESFRLNGDRAELTRETSEHVRSLEDLQRICDVDLSVWQVDHFTCDTQSKDSGIGVQCTYKVKAWLKQKKLVIGVRQELDDLVADAKLRIPARPVRRQKIAGDNMLEIGIFDAHFGKLAWGKETGHGNYDLRIAEAAWETALEAILDRTSSFQFNQVLLVLGNDIFNADSLTNLTTGGTPQDTDGRYYKSFGIVRRLATRTIDRLRTLAPVVVPMVSGNHDETSVWHLGDSLECYFHNTEDVTIQNAPTTRKYHVYGDNLIGFVHGDKGKRAALPGVMASEQPLLWGAAKYREIHVGHTHTTQVDSYPGVQIRTLRALCPPDSWHAERGFIGKLRGAEGFVWSAHEGVICQTSYTVPEAA